MGLTQGKAQLVVARVGGGQLAADLDRLGVIGERRLAHPELRLQRRLTIVIGRQLLLHVAALRIGSDQPAMDVGGALLLGESGRGLAGRVEELRELRIADREIVLRGGVGRIRAGLRFVDRKAAPFPDEGLVDALHREQDVGRVALGDGVIAAQHGVARIPGRRRRGRSPEDCSSAASAPAVSPTFGAFGLPRVLPSF